jgi:hypothetical protein
MSSESRFAPEIKSGTGIFGIILWRLKPRVIRKGQAVSSAGRAAAASRSR